MALFSTHLEWGRIYRGESILAETIQDTWSCSKWKHIQLSLTSRITRLCPVAVDVSLPGGFGQFANFDKIMSMEHDRWRYLWSRKAIDPCWAKVSSSLSRFVEEPRANSNFCSVQWCARRGVNVCACVRARVRVRVCVGMYKLNYIYRYCIMGVAIHLRNQTGGSGDYEE